jgi:hypothetical protein
MAKGNSGGKSGPSSNDGRPNGKAWKKRPKIQGRKNRGTGGYSPEKLAERAQKRGA